MSDAPDRLKAALADRYRVEREFARGGMATLYLAKDLKHDRHVAVKVLWPDLGAVMGPERFLREIDVAAQLRHPRADPIRRRSGRLGTFRERTHPATTSDIVRGRSDSSRAERKKSQTRRALNAHEPD